MIQPAGGYSGSRTASTASRSTRRARSPAPSAATFKWSRDNASLVASVLGIKQSGTDASVITVDSTGRDTWTRFEKPQQIELLDDDVEFAMRDSGRRRQARAGSPNVNHATGEIIVDQNFSPSRSSPAAHPRIRRWDTDEGRRPGRVAGRERGRPSCSRTGSASRSGDGKPAHDGDTLHAGDYWVFAARTADGSIETVDNEPPRGILHHFAPLAIVTSGAPPKVDAGLPQPVAGAVRLRGRRLRVRRLRHGRVAHVRRA